MLVTMAKAESRDDFDIEKGDYYVDLETTVTEEDVQKFAEVSGDHNPIHLDEDYAGQTFFGQRIAHGMLPASYISAAISQFEGVVIYVRQDMDFHEPVHIGDELTVRVEIDEEFEADRYWLDLSVVNQDGQDVISGGATVIIKDDSDFE